MRDLLGNPAKNPASRIPTPSGTGVQPWVDSIMADSDTVGVIDGCHILEYRISIAVVAGVVAGVVAS